MDLEDRLCGDLYSLMESSLTNVPLPFLTLLTGQPTLLFFGERILYVLESMGARCQMVRRSQSIVHACVASKNMRYPINANQEIIGYWVRDPDRRCQ